MQENTNIHFPDNDNAPLPKAQEAIYSGKNLNQALNICHEVPHSTPDVECYVCSGRTVVLIVNSSFSLRCSYQLLIDMWT